jgi:hypothetical protein
MPKSHRERLWLFGGGLVAVIMVLLGYFTFISPQRTQTADANARGSAAQLANSSLQVRIANLQQQSKNLSTYEAQVTQARLALPSASGLPEFLRTLQSIGNATLADVTSLTVGPPTEVTTVAGAAAPTASAAPTKSGAPAASGAAAAAGPRVYALPITASVSGTAAQLDEFLTQLQSVQPRAVLISQLSEAIVGAAATGPTAGQAAGNTTLQLTMQAFVAPGSAAGNAALPAPPGK